jgi:predicted ArsR family transcriptional regulator
MPRVEKRPQPTRASSGRARQALLAALRRSYRPLDATEAGLIVGLHRNTVRAHLEVLVSVDLARRTIEQRTARGRPRVLYESTTDFGDVRGEPPGTADVGYLGLAQSLAGQLSEMEDAASEAVRAGRRWAAAVDSSQLSPAELTPLEAIGAVTSLFERLGFEPEAALDEGQIRLHQCPFLEVAKGARPVVCGMHLGMLKATLERLNAPLVVTGFHPFVKQHPLLCVVNLAEDKSGSTTRSAKK